MNEQKNIQEIQSFMKEDGRFVEQPDCYGRRFYFMKDGQKFAYLWFKWGLNGWNMVYYDQPEHIPRYHIPTLQALKSTLNL